MGQGRRTRGPTGRGSPSWSWLGLHAGQTPTCALPVWPAGDWAPAPGLHVLHRRWMDAWIASVGPSAPLHVYLPPTLQAHHKTRKTVGRLPRVTFYGNACEFSLDDSGHRCPLPSSGAAPACPGGLLLEPSYFCTSPFRWRVGCSESPGPEQLACWALIISLTQGLHPNSWGSRGPQVRPGTRRRATELGVLNNNTIPNIS